MESQGSGIQNAEGFEDYGYQRLPRGSRKSHRVARFIGQAPFQEQIANGNQQTYPAQTPGRQVYSVPQQKAQQPDVRSQAFQPVFSPKTPGSATMPQSFVEPMRLPKGFDILARGKLPAIHYYSTNHEICVDYNKA